MSSIEVKIPATPESKYEIKIGTSVLASIITLTRQKFPSNPLFLITDSSLVQAGHVKTLMGTNQIAGQYVIEPAGESSKNMQTLTAILESMERARLGRDTVILALGGGVVGDMAGFAASVFKRGIIVVQIPTTTVSQADSAIGGKTGVDSSISKNAFGTFWHPAAVYIDVSALLSLDERQFRAGLAESVKHALIKDAGYFEFLEQNLDRVLRRDLEVLEEIACRNCRIKAAVVEQDPGEKNLRRILNYGHTIGHAVESASNYSLLHGECVAIGITSAGLIEKEMGLVKDNRLGRIKNLLVNLGVPVSIPKGMNEDQLLGLIRHDKKAQGPKAKFVLLEKIGQVYSKDGNWAVDVDEKAIRAALRNF